MAHFLVLAHEGDFQYVLLVKEAPALSAVLRAKDEITRIVFVAYLLDVVPFDPSHP